MSVFQARQAADRLLASLGIGEAPIDVIAIATRIGLRVFREDLGPEISGLLVRTASGTQICVAKRQAEVRRRFTIAHEIGHHVLQHQFEAGEHVHVDRGNYISQRSARASQGVDPKEIEANQFAASLLMPDRLVRVEVKALGRAPILDVHVELLAKKFKVSEQAMTIRLGTLRLL